MEERRLEINTYIYLLFMFRLIQLWDVLTQEVAMEDTMIALKKGLDASLTDRHK